MTSLGAGLGLGPREGPLECQFGFNKVWRVKPLGCHGAAIGSGRLVVREVFKRGVLHSAALHSARAFRAPRSVHAWFTHPGENANA